MTGMLARLLIVPLLCLMPALAEAGGKLPLEMLSDYLNGIRSAQASFTQISADGTISTGRVYIRRPGRVRFEYDPPERTLVLASGGSVAVIDLKSNLGPDRYPLGRTPLSLILAPNVDLRRANMVTGHDFDGTATIVTAQDPEHPEYGSIEMKFTDDPIELRQWVIRDGDGNETTVILGPLETEVTLSNALFDLSPYLPYE